MKLDDETLEFMRKHGIVDSDVHDAGQKPSSVWKSEMKDANRRFAYIGSPCRRGGHRLKNRHNQCVVCEPKYLKYQEHHNSPGTVYVAASEATGCVKIGSTVAGARAQTLRRHAYGGSDDWRIVFKLEVEKVGMVEAAAQAHIRDFQVSGQKYRSDQREAREMFRCSTTIAMDAVKRAAAAHSSARPRKSAPGG